MNSFLWSMDTIVVLAIYFGPKLATAFSKESCGGEDGRATGFSNSPYGSDEVVGSFRRAAALSISQLEHSERSLNGDSGHNSVTSTPRPGNLDPRWRCHDNDGGGLSSLDEDDFYSDSSIADDSDSIIADEETQPPAKLGTSGVTETETQPEEETLQIQTGSYEADLKQPPLSPASSPQAPARSSLMIPPVQDSIGTDGRLQQSNQQKRGLLDHPSGNDFASNDAGQHNDPFPTPGTGPRIRKRAIEADRSCFPFLPTLTT
jgi:hypothetical protein